MANNYKYFIVKDSKDFSITYFEYDKVEGYDLNPRNVKIKDAIDVNKMIVINPSMIHKLAFKKVNNKIKRLMKFAMLLFETEDNDSGLPGAYNQALTDANKIRLELYTKYKNKLKEEDKIELEQKLDLIESELKNRFMCIQNEYVMHTEKTGKSR